MTHPLKYKKKSSLVYFDFYDLSIIVIITIKKYSPFSRIFVVFARKFVIISRKFVVLYLYYDNKKNVIIYRIFVIFTRKIVIFTRKSVIINSRKPLPHKGCRGV